MIAKYRIIDFLKTAPKTANGLYIFKIPGNEYDAKKYVHRMRVELARIRKHFRNGGKQIRPFKMLEESIIADSASNTVSITLRYTVSISNDVMRNMSEIFGLVGTENKTLKYEDARPSRLADVGMKLKPIRTFEGIKVNVKT